MKKERNEDSKIETDDHWNRTYYGSPTIGGMVIVLGIIGYMIYQVVTK